MDYNLYTQQLLRVLKKRKTMLFGVFFLLSFLSWFLIKLSKNYVSTIDIAIDCVAIPKDKVLFSKEVPSVGLVVKTKGFTLLKYRFFQKRVALDVSKAKNIQGKSYIHARDFKEQLDSKLRKDLDLIAFLKDTLFLPFGNLRKKKIPVHLNIKTSFIPGYNMVDKPLVSPSYVTVWGREHLVKQITQVQTRPLVLDDLQKNHQSSVALAIPELYESLAFSTKQVQLSIHVDRFTEREFILPIRLLGIPDTVSLRIFPKQVKVLCKGSFSALQNISAKDFILAANYKDITPKSRFLPLTLEKKPDFSLQTKLLVDKVEFLITTP